MGKYAPGQSGNPRGRPAGLRSANSNTLLLLKAESLGKGAAPFLRGVYNCPQAPDQLRATAAIALLPYELARCTDRRLSRPVDLPRADSVEQALANIDELKRRGQQGLLGVEETTILISWEEASIRAIEGTVNERDLKLVESVALPAEGVPVRTVVSSPIPALPLGDGVPPIIMPDVSEPPKNGPWSPNPPPSPKPEDAPE
jgi:hypothetical protein